MKVPWNRLKDDFLPNPFQTGSKRAKNPYQIGAFVVSEGGLEPPRPFGHQLLKLARLPIPPLRRGSGSPRIGGQSTGQVAAPRQTPPPRQPSTVAHPLSGFNAVTPRTTSGLISALSEAAADRTCRAIGIPLGHRLLNSLRVQTKQRRLMPTCAAMQEPCRSHQPGSEAPTMACPGRDPGRQGLEAQSW